MAAFVYRGMAWHIALPPGKDRLAPIHALANSYFIPPGVRIMRHAVMLPCCHVPPGSVPTGADPILGCPMPVVKSWLVLGCAAAAL